MKTKFFVAVKAIIIQNNKILLLKKNISQEKYIDQDFWDLPGGRIAAGEDFHQALNRELKEELPGIKKIKIKQLLDAYQVPYKIEKNHYLILLLYQVQADVNQAQTSKEHSEIGWFTAEELEKVDLGQKEHQELAELLKSYCSPKI